MMRCSDAPARPWRALFLCGAMQGIGGGLGWSLLPPLMPTIAKELNISHAMGGLIWGAAALGIAISAPLGGAMVDKYGPRRVAALAMFVGSVACAARALCESSFSLLAAMVVFGMHIGFVAPALPKALAGHIPLARLGRATGFALVCYTFGTALTVLLARSVLAPAAGGWRPLMLIAAGAMALTGLAWWFGMRDRVALSHRAGLRDVLALRHNGQLMRVATMQLLMFGGYLALLGALPRLLTEAGVPAVRIGPAVALWLTAAGCANLIGPWLSDRIGRRPLILGGAIVACTGLGLLAIVGLSGDHASLVSALLAIAALGGGCFAPLLLALPLEIEGVGPSRAGAALGLLMLVGQIGGFLLPVLTGMFAEHGGFAGALGLLAVVHGLVVLPALGLVETGRHAVRPQGGASSAAEAEQVAA